MKAIIDGRRYNTETATPVGTWARGYGGDHDHEETVLYRTLNGAYFLAGNGGPKSRWAETCGNSSIGGEGIQVLTAAEALEWAEGRLDVEDIEAYFSDKIIDA